MSRGKRARMQMLARQKREKAAKEQALARQVMENKLKRRIELQGAHSGFIFLVWVKVVVLLLVQYC